MLATWEDESWGIFHKVYVTLSLWFNLGQNIGVDDQGKEGGKRDAAGGK